MDLSNYYMMIERERKEAVLKALIDPTTDIQEDESIRCLIRFRADEYEWVIDSNNGQLYQIDKENGKAIMIALEPDVKEHLHILALTRYKQKFT